jgi:hypothetical protein
MPVNIKYIEDQSDVEEHIAEEQQPLAIADQLVRITQEPRVERAPSRAIMSWTQALLKASKSRKYPGQHLGG